uniref:Uncharacterized protein n=1 Tax=Nelumbo nucifera TaxID=4432 RepID=A0A822Z6C5_NELNU|nr:TPA_asm: hypothetical protein HUJ06_013271 [Nelumbo nucifera]
MAQCYIFIKVKEIKHFFEKKNHFIKMIVKNQANPTKQKKMEWVKVRVGVLHCSVAQCYIFIKVKEIKHFFLKKKIISLNDSEEPGQPNQTKENGVG